MITSSSSAIRSVLLCRRTFLKTIFSSRRHQQTLTSLSKPPSRTNFGAVRPVQHLLQNGTVLLSTSEDILTNLALEEWLYRNYDFSQANELILLLWANRPAVVVGRHQNVWSEVALDYCRQNQIQVVRRNSGGGAVYHDLDNLNLSFITSKGGYNRRQNLDLLSTVLSTRFSIATSISPREDLVISSSGEKVSGTASKLNATNSYHHCTLLVDVDRQMLRRSLRKSPIIGLVSNATRSVPSPVLNLKTLNSRLSIEELVRELVDHFPERAQSTSNSSPTLQLVDPTNDRLFVNIGSIREQFSTWAWTFGKTPKFNLEEKVSIEGYEDKKTLKLLVEKGLITLISCPDSPTLEILLKANFNPLLGTQFERQPLFEALDRLKASRSTSSSSSTILIDSISTAILSAYQKCCQ